MRTEIESIKLLFYFYQDFLSKFKELLNTISSSELTLDKKLNLTTKELESSTNFIESIYKSIDSECSMMKIQVQELKDELFKYQTPEYEKVKDNYFILSNKLVSMEYEISQIDLKLKEYKKNKNLALIELLFRDPVNLAKVLDNELVNVRDNTTKLTKTINYYKNKKIECEKVINTLKEELKNIEAPKKITVFQKSDNSCIIEKNDNTESFTQTSSYNYNSTKQKLKETLKKIRRKINEGHTDLDEFKALVLKVENDNNEKKTELTDKYDYLCKLQLELEKVKEKYNNINKENI